MTDLCPVSGGLQWLLNPFPAASQTSTCKRWERPVSQNWDRTWEPAAQGGGRCLLSFTNVLVRKGRLQVSRDTEPVPSFWSENDGKGMQEIY